MYIKFIILTVFKCIVSNIRYSHIVVQPISKAFSFCKAETLSVQFSRSVVSDSLPPHGLQHSRPTCPSPTPRAYSNSFVLWVGDAIQPSHPVSSPSPALKLSQHQGLFKWVSSLHQMARVLAWCVWRASVLPMHTQDWSPLGWTGWISLQSKGLSRIFSNTTVQKHQFFGAQLSL